ncbi:MAG: type II CRISPR-associated endonuclease Cas1 [Candidatus Fimenecus sp.]
MSWRTIVITGHAKLDYKMDYLVVRKQDEISRIYIGEIGLLLIESTAVSMTAMLLSELTKNKVKIVFCDEKRNPQSEIIPYYGTHDTSMKIKQQMSWEEFIKEEVATEIVREKIKKQMEFLYELGYERQGELLKQYVRELKLKDESNREGHAAKVYFNALFGMDFVRNEDTPINAALNYGYSILLSCFNREIVSAGHITQIGILHDNRFNQFNLASDFMEPFRILVDRKVVELSPNDFDKYEKIELVNILNQNVIIAQKNHTVNNAIKIYCRSLFDALNNRDIADIKFYKNEL